MRISDSDQIYALPLFREMAPENFQALTQAALYQRFPAHVVLLNAGDTPDFLYVLVEGMVDLYASHDEQDSSLAILSPLTTFILAAVIRDAVYLTSART